MTPQTFAFVFMPALTIFVGVVGYAVISFTAPNKTEADRIAAKRPDVVPTYSRPAGG